MTLIWRCLIAWYQARSWTISTQRTATERNFCPVLVIKHIEQCSFLNYDSRLSQFFGQGSISHFPGKLALQSLIWILPSSTHTAQYLSLSHSLLSCFSLSNFSSGSSSHLVFLKSLGLDNLRHQLEDKSSVGFLLASYDQDEDSGRW